MAYRMYCLKRWRCSSAVSTTVSGIPELVEDGANGCLVPPGDDAALADELPRLALMMPHCANHSERPGALRSRAILTSIAT